jgi:hypothetical protein
MCTCMRYPVSRCGATSGGSLGGVPVARRTALSTKSTKQASTPSRARNSVQHQDPIVAREVIVNQLEASHVIQK